MRSVRGERVQEAIERYVTTGQHMRIRSAPVSTREGMRQIQGTLRPHEPANRNGISIGSAVFAQLIRLPSMRTHRSRYTRHSVAIDRRISTSRVVRPVLDRK